MSVAHAQEPTQARPQTAPTGVLPIDGIAAVVGTTAILMSDVEAALASQQVQGRTEVGAELAQR